MDRGAAEKDRVAIRRRMRDELRRQRSARLSTKTEPRLALTLSAHGRPIVPNPPRGENDKPSRTGRSEKGAGAAECPPPASAAAPAARPKNSLRLNLMFMPPIHSSTHRRGLSIHLGP